MAYLPLPTRGSKSAVYVVRQRHHNHAIIGCMLEQSFTGWEFMKNGVRDYKRRFWDENSRHSCIQMFHLHMKWSCTICLPSEWWGHPLEFPTSAGMWVRKIKAKKRFLLEHYQSTSQYTGSVLVISIWSTYRGVVFCGGIGFSFVQRHNKQTALDGLQDAGVDGVKADQMLSGLGRWTERCW